MDKTINYYNDNASDFIQGTIDVDFTQAQERFRSKLRSGAYILDFGCGSGRDTKYFLDQGFNVDATDGAYMLCKKASKYTGIKVKHLLFQDFNEKDKYDGIWACSSILHLPQNELKEVLLKMIIALKSTGIIYTSFKYGTFEGERHGRYFIDFTKESFRDFIGDIDGLKIEEQWVTNDVRPDREEEKWLNLILQKQDIN
ncbi:MAG: class I SAM-dependent methyltransferase [Anaerostipes sp.]|nr:class I SAM-dependent methyltransferase [Anaerostipes sp.]